MNSNRRSWRLILAGCNNVTRRIGGTWLVIRERWLVECGSSFAIRELLNVEASLMLFVLRLGFGSGCIFSGLRGILNEVLLRLGRVA